MLRAQLVVGTLVAVSSGLCGAKGCADRHIELDGEAADCARAGAALSSTGLVGACSTHFCPSCEYSGTCDLSCGLCVAGEVEVAELTLNEPTPDDDGWWPCAPGLVLDCWGSCRSAKDCTLESTSYASCLDWIGDGACDDGCSPGCGDGAGRALSDDQCGRVADGGVPMAFNCPLYGCDGNDCEACGANPAVVPRGVQLAPRRVIDALRAQWTARSSKAGALDTTASTLHWPGPELTTFAVSSARAAQAGRSGSFYPQCRDAALWIDGRRAGCQELIATGAASCARDFCDGCGSAAGACDASCGLCSPLLDPAEESPWPATPQLLATAVGDVVAEAGTPLLPHPGLPPTPESLERSHGRRSHGRGPGRVSWVIILTMAVSPLQGITHTRRLTPLLRVRDYARSLRRWAGAPFAENSGARRHAQHPSSAGNGTASVASTAAAGAAEAPGVAPWPLVVVESSGANLTVLRRAVDEGRRLAASTASNAGGRAGARLLVREIEFVSLRLTRGAVGDLARGKGVAEAASVAAALRTSALVAKHRPSHACKVTGRYFAPKIDAELSRVARDADAADAQAVGAEVGASGAGALPRQLGGGLLVVHQSTPSPWTLFDGVLRSEVVAFALDPPLHPTVTGPAGACGGDRGDGTPGVGGACPEELGPRGAEVLSWLFGGQDEAAGRPMERVLFEVARALNASAPSGAMPVRVFHPLAVDRTRNAENDEVLQL